MILTGLQYYDWMHLGYPLDPNDKECVAARRRRNKRDAWMLDIAMHSQMEYKESFRQWLGVWRSMRGLTFEEVNRQ